MNSVPEIIIPENFQQLQILQVTGNTVRARVTATDADAGDELMFHWSVPPLVDYFQGDNITGAITTSYLDFQRDELTDGDEIDCIVTDSIDRVIINWQVEKE